MRLVALIIVVQAGLVFTSCTKKKAASIEPDFIVREFITASSSAQKLTDREKIMAFCQGELRRTLERMPEEQFQLAYLSGGLQVQAIQILKSEVKGDKATVTYRLTLKNGQGDQPTEETTERTVELERTPQSGWLIESIATQSDKIAFTRGMMF